MEKIDTEDLKKSLENITNLTGGILKWKLKVLESVSQIINKEPHRYRGFGPYWWGLKKELILAGHNYLGESSDLAMLEKTDYKNSELNMLAAVLYNQFLVDQGIMYSNIHYINENDEQHEYVLEDPDMEAIIKFRKYI